MPTEENKDKSQEKQHKGISTPESLKVIGRKKKMIFGFTLMLVGIGLVALVAYPTYNNRKVTLQTLATKEAELNELTIRVNQLKKVERLVATIDKNTELTKQAVPETTDIPVGMGTVQEIAESSGVTIASFSYGGEGFSPISAPASGAQGANASAEKNFDSYRMNIVVRGRFDNLKTFLENLENSRRLLDASNFSYSVERGSTELVSNVYSLRLLINAYKKEFTPNAVEINLEQYTDVISRLESMQFYVVNLDTPIGKQNPFSEDVEGESTNTNQVNSVDVNVIELEGGAEASDGSSFFNSNPSTTNINEQQNANNPENTTNSEVVEDVEAPEGDTLQILQQLLQEEGVQITE